MQNARVSLDPLIHMTKLRRRQGMIKCNRINQCLDTDDLEKARQTASNLIDEVRKGDTTTLERLRLKSPRAYTLSRRRIQFKSGASKSAPAAPIAGIPGGTAIGRP